MHSFRETTPSRRPDRKVCKHYSSYHKTLREDFNQRCGYCDDSDLLRIRSYTIDHFVPQNPENFKHDINPNFYYNLVYSCKYCNSSKTNKWPTNKVDLHHNQVCGFVDPTENEYTNMFTRNNNGQIIPVNIDNELAKYIIRELKLWLPIHERMWKLERIRMLNCQIKNKLRSLADNDSRKQLEQIHYKVLLLIDEIHECIFVENE